MSVFSESYGFNAFSSSLFFSIVCMVVLPFLIIREIFKPIDQRKAPAGKQWKLPPGPRGIPIFGSLLEFRKARSDSAQLSQWLSSLSQYGEMTTVHLGSKTWVLLNSDRVVSELIAKRGALTSERPDLPIASSLVSNDKRSVLRRSARWAEGRRAMHHLLNGAALRTYGGWQELETAHLLAACLLQPRRWHKHHFRYANSVVHWIVLGERLLRPTPELDALLAVTIEFVRAINASLVDFFPRLAALPRVLQPWRAYWARMGAAHRAVFVAWWEPVKRAVEAGTAPASFVRDGLLAEDTAYCGTDEEAMYLALSVVSAGSDNTRLALNTFVMAVLCHPGVFERARREIDGVCGDGGGSGAGGGTGAGSGTGTGAATASTLRLPTLADMPALPFTCAIIKELLRWRPLVPTIPPHDLTQDLDFEGYRFPAGISFVINSIAVCNAVPDPDAFRPERWIDGKGGEANITEGLWQFGGGRRVCVGYRVAQMELFIAVARLIAGFDYKANGPYDSRRLRHDIMDEPFPVTVSVRSKAYEELILREAERLGVLQSAKDGF
ncbi:cytochrome protein [Glonium stellatum]|uniref:Cytochrome protein n=1 Tax=Glonium stellatum TaxID=574774 RepID=A0A8E2JRU1_9PEZI|nr:cytochrome protein [Glonium stellatum]